MEYYSAIRKEKNSNTSYNMNGPGKHDAKWKKPDRRLHF